MDGADKSLLIFSVLGIASAIYWSVFVFFPLNQLLAKIGLLLNGAWLVGYILVVLTIVFGGLHLHLR
jgi:hypothetical protein